MTGWQPVDGASIAYARAGTGNPAVVLQSGLGDGKEVWAEVYSGLASISTVVAYDRSGYDDSPEAPGPRDPVAMARQQRELLRALGFAPPYVLVGHSLGGLYQYVYARLYPEEVAALVLIDPTHPHLWERIQSDDPALARRLGWIRKYLFSPTMKREFDEVEAGLEGIDLNTPLRVPIRLLVRTEFARIEGKGYEALEPRLVGDWERMTGVKAERVAEAGHYIQRDRPEAVAQAVQEALQAGAEARHSAP